jgi:hypothetical protein
MYTPRREVAMTKNSLDPIRVDVITYVPTQYSH